MINLLPPEYKKQVAFSRYNRHLVKYMLLAITIAGAMSAVLFLGVYRAERELAQINEVIDQRQEAINKFNGTQDRAKTIESKLNKIDALYQQQSYYSGFLDELGEAFPAWAEITNIALTRGDDVSAAESTNNQDPKRLSMQLRVNTQDQVTELRDILIDMDRVDFVDIQSFSSNNEETRDEDQETGVAATFVLALSQPPYEPLAEDEEAQQ